jgi:hypothetical protein
MEKTQGGGICFCELDEYQNDGRRSVILVLIKYAM